MVVVVVLLWVLVGFRVVTLFILQAARGRSITTEYTEGVIAWRSFATVLSAVILALAALGLAGAVA